VVVAFITCLTTFLPCSCRGDPLSARCSGCRRPFQYGWRLARLRWGAHPSLACHL